MKILTKLFSIYLFMIGLSAAYGGWVIIYTDMMNFPPDILATTPFDSFIIPGIILGVFYSSLQFTAAVLLWIKHKWMYEAVAVAAFCQLIWMITEVYLIPDHHWIQIVYLAFAILSLIILLFLLKYFPLTATPNRHAQ